MNLNLPSNQISSYILSLSFRSMQWNNIAIKKRPQYIVIFHSRVNLGRKTSEYYFALRSTHFAFIRLNDGSHSHKETARRAKQCFIVIVWRKSDWLFLLFTIFLTFHLFIFCSLFLLFFVFFFLSFHSHAGAAAAAYYVSFA